MALCTVGTRALNLRTTIPKSTVRGYVSASSCAGNPQRRKLATTAQATGTGRSSSGGVLDRPTIEKAPSPGKDTKKKQPPMYRVMLHNDNFNRREYVVQVLMKIVDGMTVDIAVNVMQEAHINGLAAVVVVDQDIAEEYCQGLRNNGLISSIEPVTK